MVTKNAAGGNSAPNLKGLASCVADAKSAGQDFTSGPVFPSDYDLLRARVQSSLPRVPVIFQDATAKPLLATLDRLGLDGYVQELQGEGGPLLRDIAQSILQRGSGYMEAETAAFEELVADLYDGFLSAEDRVGIKMPERVIIPPIVKWGNPRWGPYTWPFDATNAYGLHNPVVSLPPATSGKGLMVWATIGHETCGHDVLHANHGLQNEMAAKVRDALHKVKAIRDAKLDESKWRRPGVIRS